MLAALPATHQIVTAHGLIHATPFAAFAVQAGFLLGATLVAAETLLADTTSGGLGRGDEQRVVGRANLLPGHPLTLAISTYLAVTAADLSALLRRRTAGSVRRAGAITASVTTALLVLRALGARSSASNAARAPGSAGIRKPRPVRVGAGGVGCSNALPVLTDAALPAGDSLTFLMTLGMRSRGEPGRHPEPESPERPVCRQPTDL